MRLQGVFPALTTPFADGRVALERLRANVERYEELGLAGYLVLGSTGEALLLDEDERERVLVAARRAIPASRTLIAGASAESTAGAIRQARQAAERGADCVLVSTPHYYRSEMTGPALVEHFRRVADASPRPVLLYNVPKFTGIVLPVEVVSDLARHPNVAGMKDSAGDLAYLREIVARAGERFRVLCGAAALAAEALSAGAAGVVLAAAVVLPEVFQRLAREHAAGGDGAAALQARIVGAARVLAEQHGIPGIKAGLELRGLHGGEPRPPLRPVSDGARGEIARAIDALVDDGLLAGRRWSAAP